MPTQAITKTSLKAAGQLLKPGQLLRTGPLSNSVKEAFTAAKPGLELIEQRIKTRLGSDAPQLTEISEYLLSLGGKRIRPVLAVLCHRLCGVLSNPKDELIDAAAGIELIHMATLLHDDIIDQAATRRRQVSAFKKFGLTPSLLAGDFLLVRAFGLCAHLDEVIVEATEKACVELTEGEILEGTIDPERKYELDDYLNVIEKKTASLFSLAAVVGGHLAGINRTAVDVMGEFGRNAGIAFQMVDDILDVTADEDLLGKPAGADLRQKTPSLLNILWLKSGDPKAKEFFTREQIAQEDAKATADYLKAHPVIEEARTIASEYAVRAESSLFELELPNVDEKSRQQLCAILQYTLERCL